MIEEARGHISLPDELKIRFDGYFDGRIDEIEEEIEEVKKWPRTIKLGKIIRRQDQELRWLNRLKDEMQKAQAYINSFIEKELGK